MTSRFVFAPIALALFFAASCRTAGARSDATHGGKPTATATASAIGRPGKLGVWRGDFTEHTDDNRDSFYRADLAFSDTPYLGEITIPGDYRRQTAHIQFASVDVRPDGSLVIVTISRLRLEATISPDLKTMTGTMAGPGIAGTFTLRHVE